MDIGNPFRTLADGMPSEDLFALEESTQKLTSSNAWQEICQMVEEGKEVVSHQIVHGKTHERAQYARFAGYLSGADAFVDAVRTIKEAAAARRGKLEADAEREREEKAELQEAEKPWGTTVES